jgi:hypothetical protein
MEENTVLLLARKDSPGEKKLSLLQNSVKFSVAPEIFDGNQISSYKCGKNGIEHEHKHAIEDY